MMGAGINPSAMRPAPRMITRPGHQSRPREGPKSLSPGSEIAHSLGKDKGQQQDGDEEQQEPVGKPGEKSVYRHSHEQAGLTEAVEH